MRLVVVGGAWLWPGSTNVQEAQLVAVHVLCKAFEAAVVAVDRRVS